MYFISDNDLRESVYSALSSQTREFRQRLSFGEGTGSRFNKQISFDAGIKKIDISQVGNADNNGIVLGNCCSSSATVEFYNPSKTYRYNDKTMFVECGVKIPFEPTYNVSGGYYLTSNGKWVSGNTIYSKSTEMLPVFENDSFTYTGRGEHGTASVLWYDGDKKFLYAEEHAVQTGDHVTTVTIQAPLSASFVRFQSHDYDSEVTLKVSRNNDSYFYIPCGYYKVEKPETDDDWKTVKITAYDTIDEMSGKWNTSLTMPTTSYLLIEEIAGKYNLELEIDSVILSSLKKRQITESEASMLTAYKEREVIGFLIGCLGGNARINTVGKLHIAIYDPFPVNVFDITPKVQWQNGFKKTLETEFEIASITSGVGDNVFTAGTGKGITFVNPLITEDEIAKIYENYGGVTFQPSTCEWRGNPCVECGDVVFVTDKSGAYYTVFVARQDIDLTGGLSMTTHCPSGDSDVSFDTLNDEVRQALNKQYTELQQAIIDATNKINGALGGYYEVLDSDNDGNPDGWLIKEFEDGHGGLIRANKAGIGLSKDGGKTYRTAITYDGINADEITSGKVKAEFIETDKLVVGMSNVNGLVSKLDTLLAIADGAQTTADTTSLILGGLTALENGVTVVKGSSILTGSIGANQIAASSITADKLNVGLGNSNYAATEEWDGDVSYLKYEFDSSYSSNVKMISSATSTEKRLHLTKHFYASKGSKIFYNAIAYADGTTNSANTYIGIGLYYQESNGSWTNKGYATTVNKSLKTEHKLTKEYTVSTDGYFRIDVWFSCCDTNAYLKKIYVAQGMPGEMLVNGVISSVNGNSYFDLNNNILRTDNAQIVGGSIEIGGTEYKTKISGGSLTQSIQSGSIVGGLVPVGSGGNLYQALYFDGASATGIHLGYKTSSGFNYLFELTKNKMYASVPIQSEGTAFSGLSYTRDFGSDGSATVKAGVGEWANLSNDVNFDNVKLNNNKKSYQGYEYYITDALSTKDVYYGLTKWISVNGARTLDLSFNYCSYGFAYFCLMYQTSSQVGTVYMTVGENFLFSQKGDADKTDGSYYGSINIPSNAERIAIYVTPENGNSSYWAGWRNVSMSLYYGKRTSCALELLDSSNQTESRIDIASSDGEAVAMIRLRSAKGNSGILELGSSDFWFNGTAILEELKSLNDRVSALGG